MCNYTFGYWFFLAQHSLEERKNDSSFRNSDHLDWDDLIALDDLLGNKRAEKAIGQTEQDSLRTPENHYRSRNSLGSNILFACR